MKYLNLNQTEHKFEKENLVTLKEGYDLLRCSICGLKAKRRGISEIVEIDGRVSNERIRKCSGVKENEYIGRKIKITQCTAVGNAFSNITPNSIHEIIKPPGEYVNGDRGVWVMGNGEPVKVLFDEFNYE